MKKNKGFTLIELLAVIVILAVIALIATPLIMNVINDSKENSIKRSVNNIQSLVETTYASELIKNDKYAFNQADVKYKGEQYKDIKMGVNSKGDASVAIYKDNKCFYALDGAKEVKTEKLDKDTCLAKVGGFVPTGDPLALKYCDTTVTTECFKNDGNYTGAPGTVGNNWLWYGGHLWRIMKEDKTEKSLTLITSYPVTAISWRDISGDVTSLEDSHVGSWLNEVFYPSLPQTVKSNVLPMTYDRKIWNGTSAVNETKSNINIRLLTEVEYSASGLASGYLNISDSYWLSDIDSAFGVSYVDYYEGTMTDSSPILGYGVRPIIKVQSDLKTTKGSGTLVDPYTVSEEKSKNTSNISVGEYVSVPKSDGSTYLTRVVKYDADGVKVILNGIYNTSEFGTNITLSNASTIYTGSLTSFKNTLDTKYVDLNNHQYNMTMYPNGETWNNNATMATLDIGLPSVGEMFSGNDIDMTYESNDKTFVDGLNILHSSMNSYWSANSQASHSVRYMDGQGKIFSTSYYVAFGVRPVFYINSGMNITGGEGTANNPYTLK